MSDDAMHAVMMALLTATAGCMLAMAAGMARASRPLVSWTGVTFDLAAVAYAIKLWNNQSHILPIWLSAPVIAVSASTVGWFWLFVMALFEVRFGGHTWPGSPLREVLDDSLGFTTGRVEATRDGWVYMREFSLP